MVAGELLSISSEDVVVDTGGRGFSAWTWSGDSFIA